MSPYLFFFTAVLGKGSSGTWRTLPAQKTEEVTFQGTPYSFTKTQRAEFVIMCLGSAGV